jgi:hypothetical protein
MCIGGGMESLSGTGTERAVVDRAANLEQEIGTSTCARTLRSLPVSFAITLH